MPNLIIFLFDKQNNEYVDEKIICQCCFGQGVIEDIFCKEPYLNTCNDYVDEL